ncbi:uncharacterized protein OCT59_004317 [Rhizophagus irregularis]|uniref:uncharacterized protein n=1 Tax=Rhizophagus irregularis TaxID=588596 RepID=UPI003330558F|nr:hypothetical protein OCT59_004317 [Rhizophagus irregularis]
MDGEARKYAVTYSNLQINKQFKTSKEQEKYKKRFKNSLKNNKNKWQVTNHGIGSKVLIFKHKLIRRSDILKKQYISEKEMEFLVDQVTSEVGYKMLIDDIFINHSFNEEHFFELRKKKDASFERKDMDRIMSLAQILNRREPITRAEFHQGLNSIRDKRLLTTYCNGIRRGRRGRGITHDYVVNQCAIKAHKLEQVKEEKRCGISGKDKKAKSHSKRTEVDVKDVGCKMLESNWNKWNDLAFHRGGHWANF